MPFYGEDPDAPPPTEEQLAARRPPLDLGPVKRWERTPAEGWVRKPDEVMAVEQELHAEGLDKEVVRGLFRALRNVGKALDENDKERIIASWALMNDAQRKAFGLPKTQKALAQMVGLTTRAVRNRLNSKEWERRWGQNVIGQSILMRRYFDVVAALAEDAAKPGCPASTRKLYFQLTGDLIPDPDAEDGVRRASLASGDTDQWSKTTASIFLSNEQIRLVIEELGGNEAAQNKMMDALASALKSWSDGRLSGKKEENVEDAEFEVLEQPPAFLTQATAALKRQGG